MRLASFLFIVLSFSACRPKKSIEIIFPENVGVAYTDLDFDYGGDDFYMYQLRHSFSFRDSVMFAWYGQAFFKSFDEPNLSISQPQENMFRLTVENEHSGYAMALTLTAGMITIKEVKTGYPYGFYDESLLDPVESNLIGLFAFYIPLHEYRDKDKGKRFTDSVTGLYPELKDPRYIMYLLKKSRKAEEKFTYRKWSRSLPVEKYLNLVDKLNNSEFWKMNVTHDCHSSNSYLHPDVFRFEAATLDRYYGVNFTECDDIPLLHELCTELREYSGSVESEKKYLDKQRKKYLKKKYSKSGN